MATSPARLFDPGESTPRPAWPEGVGGRGAILSDCGTYRYALWRDLEYENGFEADGRVLFVMLNPSTADDRQDDNTIRRCIGFAREWGHEQLVVVNLYALRATDPRELRRHSDPVGPKNDRWIEDLSASAARVVAAWGANTFVTQDRVDHVLHLIKGDSELLYGVECLGLTAEGHPRHPLFVPRDQKLLTYSPIEKGEK